MRGLSEEQSERIRRDTAQLLEGTGFRVQHEELLRLAARAGARVEEGGLVKLPGELLEELLAKAPE